MKAIIKPALAAAALAAALALAALACSAEAELTAPDWKEYDSQRNAKYTNNLNDASVAPTIQSGTLPLPATGTTITAEQKQLVIKFPANADFLKKENSGIEAALKEFLSIYTFTNPAVVIATPPSATENYVFSTKGSDINYTFVRRNNDGTHAYITIQLDNSALPATQPASPGLPVGAVIKIDGAKYKVGGFGLDLDNDGKAGEAPYDDVFLQVTVAGSNTYVPPGGGSLTGPGVLTLTIGSVGGGPFTANTSQAFAVAELSGAGIGGSTADAPANLRRKAILEAVAGKFKIQKFNDGKWDDVSATIQYQNDPVAAVGYFGRLIVSGFTPEDLGIYRIYASGLKGLKTDGQATFYGVEQKITIAGGTTPSTGGKRKGDYVSGNAGFSLNSRQFVNSSDLSFSVDSINYNNAGKKGTLILEFDGVELTASSADYFVKEDVDMFNKNFKIAYRTGNQKNITDLTAHDDIAFAKISKVEFEKIMSPGANSTQTGTKVILTLDEGYSFTHGSAFQAYLLLSPGFEYGNSSLTFGSFTAIDTVIDGVRGWALYGQI